MRYFNAQYSCSKILAVSATRLKLIQQSSPPIRPIDDGVVLSAPLYWILARAKPWPAAQVMHSFDTPSGSSWLLVLKGQNAELTTCGQTVPSRTKK